VGLEAEATKTAMKLKYDEHVDAAYVEVAGPIPPGGVDYTEELDQDRNVDRDADEVILGYEFLNVRRYGVRLDDLDHRDELAQVFRDAGIKERDWSTPRPSPQAQGKAAG
jgi:uncharacterized protein YuzE